MDILTHRFIEKIPEAGCWIWMGALNDSGYGMASTQRKDGSWKMKRAHVLAYEAVHGQVPKGLFVCHRCDVRCCINPSHLFVGTNTDNMVDASRKGRLPRGEKHHGCKLSVEAVREIRASSETRSLARKFGVHRTSIQQIRQRKNWGWVDK